jgi:serine/threonine protein kinase
MQPPALLDQLHWPSRHAVRADQQAYTLLVHVAEQVAVAMAFLHANRMVHLDLKPANVLLMGSAERPTAKLCDFGLSRKFTSRKTHSRASSTVMLPPVAEKILGTTAFMAPELLARQAADASLPPFVELCQCDVYSFGIMLACMVSRNQIFQDVFNGANMDPESHLKQIVQAGARPTDALQECPEELKALIELCWSQQPSR